MQRVTAAALFLAATAVLVGPAAGQVVPFVGVTGGTATLPQPYSNSCTDDDGRTNNLGVHGGVQHGQLSLRVGYERRSEHNVFLCVQHAFAAESGIYEFTGPARGHANGLRIATARIGYSPEFARTVTAYGGAGWETVEGEPLALVGLALLTGGRLRIGGGVEYMRLAATYRTIEQEWQDWVPIRTTVLDEERRCRSSVSFWAGVELQLARRR
jgi:opacity protein-like surface antigen